MNLRSLAVGLLLTVMMLAAGTSALAEETLPRIVSIRVEPDSLNLVFQVEQGAFDPIVSVSDLGEGDGFRIVIEGQDVELGAAMKYDTRALAKQLTSMVQGVKSVQIKEEGASSFRLIVETRDRIQPQVRSNTGSLVTVSLRGATPTQAVAKRRIVAPPQPKPQNETSVQLPEITLDPNDSTSPDEPQQKSAPGPVSHFDAAQPTFSIYEVVHQPKVDGVIRQAWGEYRQGRLSSAQMMLEAYLGKRPQDTVGRYLLALVHLANDEYQRATMALQKTIEQDGQFLPAWIDLVRLNLKEGNFSETEELLEKALAQFPGQPDLFYSKGLLLEAKGDVGQAQDFYLRVLSREPRHWMAHYRLAITELKSNRPRAAEVELKRILSANPDDIAALKALGYAYHRDESLTDALKVYRQALKPDVLINFAGLLKEQNRDQDALDLYRAAEVIAPDDQDIQYNLGMLYADLNQPKSAIRALTRFMGLAQDNPRGFDGEDERLGRATAKLKKLGATPPKEGWLKSLSDGEKKAIDYQFEVSATEDAKQD